MTKVTVLGDGGWGTTLSLILNANNHDVTLWGFFPSYIETLKQTRENTKFLPGIPIPESIALTSDLKTAVADAEIICVVVPSQHVRSVCKNIKPHLKKDIPIISASKGIEIKTLKTMSQIIKEEINTDQIVILSGPSHAEETAKKCPTTVVAASKNKSLAELTQKLFFTESFRIYTNADVIGVELGGALKNVIAIAAGMCDGLDLGNNAKAALLTRGLAEITRLGNQMGGKPNTFAGLSGIGDLITTCVSPYGRNKKFGESIAKGKTKDQILNESEMVFEGVATTESAFLLAQKHQIDMPIVTSVYNVLYKNNSVKEAVSSLMKRSPKPEEY